MTGGFGRYARVDLTTASYAAVPYPAAWTRRLIGGVGLGTAILWRETSPGYDPLGEDAAVVFAFSPFVGTPLTTSAKLAVVAKSPLTQRLNDALSSSDFAIVGKRTGHDAIVLRGRAPEPSVVLLDEGTLRLVPAGELWGSGKTMDAVDEALRDAHPGFHFAVIGPAGENLVRYASLANGGRHAGRGGLGAVLGAMRVKAVGVRGAQRLELGDREGLVAIAKDWAQRSLGPGTEKYRELGTVANLATFNRLAVLPTRNFQQASFEGAAALSGEELHRTRAQGRGSCRNCTIGCEHFFAAGDRRVKVEYESVFALGPLCGVSDADLVLEASARCDELGLDTISAGGTLAFAMECAERGLFAGTPWESDAASLRFGDGEGVLRMLTAIAERSGIGDLLAEGSRRVAERLGPPAPDFAPHVKGLELPGYEPRALQTMALGFAVGSRGADHNKSGAYEVDFSSAVNRFDPGPEAAALAAGTEDRAALLDALILCKFLRGIFDDVWTEAAEGLTAVTGEGWSADELRDVARRIVWLKKRFNEREGWQRHEDALPKRFLTQEAGSGSLTRERLDRLIASYYAHRGYDAEGRMPEALWRGSGLAELLDPA